MIMRITSVDVDPELRRVKVMVAARDQSVKEVVREALTRETRKTTEYTLDEPDSVEDRAWLGSDLSKLGNSSLMNGKKKSWRRASL